ncbi:MAG TPA: hypothetical protein VLB76_04895 [Thermoanaerobaculia bacterium]|jgi:hypothetical protein|nr:hypothetical protein [Thermoanaerobaculia bacterium]
MRRIWKIFSIGMGLALLALAAGAQQVTLPLEKFEQLRTRANQETETPARPPAPYALELAEYEVKVGPESARVAQMLRFTLYDDQWQTVPLGEAGSFIAADFKGSEGRVEVSDEGLKMHVRGRGRREVRLESAVPVARDDKATRPTWSFGLRFPAAAVVRGRIEAPAAVEELDVQGSGLILPISPGGGWTFVALPATEVRWTLSGRATVPQRAQLPLRFEATSATATTLSRTRLQVLGWIEVRIAQGRLETLRVPVPAGLEVADVRGPSAGWKVEAGTLIVTPLAPVEDALAVEIVLTGDPKDHFATPLLIPEGSARTALLAKAALKGDGILSLTDPGAARGSDEREAARLPDSLKAIDGRLFAVADPARPPLWEAAWAERTEVLAAQVDRLLVDVAIGEAGKASYQLWAEVRNRGAQQLTLTLPAGFELAVGHRDGVMVVPGVTGPGSTGGSLSIPLLTQDAAQVVHLEGVVPLPLPRGKGDFSVPLPALSAPVARVEVRLVLPGGRSYELGEKARAGQVSPPPGAAARKAVSGLAVQANTQINAGQAFATQQGAPALYNVPPGFAFLQAAWSALSAAPPPLAVHVEREKEKPEWF